MLVCLVHCVKCNNIAKIPAHGTLAGMAPNYVLKSTGSPVDLCIPVKVLICTFAMLKELYNFRMSSDLSSHINSSFLHTPMAQLDPFNNLDRKQKPLHESNNVHIVTLIVTISHIPLRECPLIPPSIQLRHNVHLSLVLHPSSHHHLHQVFTPSTMFLCEHMKCVICFSGCNWWLWYKSIAS
jgi:hypothetical protein